jgi:lipoprotein-anchoring transpeptidase ErfK/SrfK
VSDELSAVLREFAAEAEQGARPVLTGAEVRGRAVRRARRRMAGTLGAVALALVGFALTLDLTGKDDDRQLPGAAAPAVPSQSLSTRPSPSAASAAVSTPVSAVPATGTLELTKRALFLGGRVMPLTLDSSNSPAFAGPLTVYGKHDTKVVTVTDSTDGVGLYTEVTLAVELRDADNTPVYVGVTRSYKGKSLGTQGTDGTGGWIGLDGADAKWFYQDVKIGTVISVTGD